jgi:hypothetical protein
MNVGPKLKSQSLKGHVPPVLAPVGEVVAGVAAAVCLLHALKHGFVMTGLTASQTALAEEHAMMLIIVALQSISHKSLRFAFMKGTAMIGL